MNPATQAKVEELVAAAIAAGDGGAEVLSALRDAYRDALIDYEAEQNIPVPNMSGVDLLRLLAYLNDGRGVEDIQAVYKRLKQAIAEKNQSQFWRLLFMLLKAYRQMNPYI